jgi:hypothetical protein
MHPGIMGALGKMSVRPAFEDQPGFTVDPKNFAGKSEDDILALREAGSQQELDWLLFDQQDAAEQARISGLRGMGTALLGGFIAGFPEGYLTGMGAFKAFQMAKVGSTALALQGRSGAAWASAAAENIGGNVAGLAIADAMGQHVGTDDYAMAVGFGALVTPLTAWGSLGQAAKIHADNAANRIAADAAAKIEAKKAKAIENLGENATPEQILAEMQRLDAAEIQHTLSVDRGRRLIDEPVDEAGQPEVAPTLSSKTASDVATETGIKAVNAPGKDLTIVNDPEGFIDNSLLRNVMDESASEAWYNPKNTDGTPNTAAASLRRAETVKEFGISFDDIHALAPGVHPTKGLNATLPDKMAVSIANWVHKHFMNDTRIVLMNGDTLKPGTNGMASIMTVGDSKAVVVQARSGMHSTLIHELGHAVVMSQWNRIVKGGIKDGFFKAHAKFVENYTKALPTVDGIPGSTQAALMRSGLSSGYGVTQFMRANPEGFIASLFDVVLGMVKRNGDLMKSHGNIKHAADYIPNANEFSAEQFVKYIEAVTEKQVKWEPRDIPTELVEWMRDAIRKITELFTAAKKNNWIAPDQGMVDFWEAIRKVNRAAVSKETRASAGLDPKAGSRKPSAPQEGAPSAASAEAGWRGDPIAAKYGLDLLPDATPEQAAEAKAILSLYKRADDPQAPWNNIDPERVKSLTDNGLFNVASTSLLMLKSDNPVVRMVAAELLENPAGAAGRRGTAAMATYLNMRKFTGTIVPDIQDSYKVWRTQHGGSILEDTWGGKKWEQFNTLVAEEIEGRRTGLPGSGDPAVIAAANAAEKSFERMRSAQVGAKTIGWGGLPANSIGYMPHRLSPEKVRNMTSAQRQTLHAALVDQFVSIEGFDITFSAQLASQYIDRVNLRAVGGFDAPVNIHQVGAADMVEDALTAMGLNKTEVVAQMKKYMRGSAGHVKGRLKLDLLKRDESGFRLLDLYDTNILNLVRNQANRVAGEVALAEFGVMGQPGLKLLKQAMTHGGDTSKAQVKELEAFDQVAAEFLGQPFGTNNSKWADRVLMTTSLARLGGMGFTQFAEAINGIWSLGAAKALGTIPEFPRLRAEAKALSRGEKVDNGILSSIEKYSGVDFGTDSYKIKFPFDNGSLEHMTYGKDSVTFADRALRGATHLQGKLSLWRSIHAAQQRGMAEQIVAKAARMLADNTDDVALRDMGITPELAFRLRNDISEAAIFEGGRLKEFDITKFRDTAAANEFVQAIHRGTSQIIQGTFIGETGKWAHDGMLRILTQFRTFSITSIEKQWARQRGNYGVAGALGILLGSMSLAAPIYMARVAMNSIGRPDRDEYLERQLSFTQIARASLNYVALSGLSGDMLDALTALTGTGEMTGGRSNAQSQFIGNVVAPAAGLADDLWRAMQNNKEGTDPHDLIKNLPFSKLPVLQQAINALDE